MASGEGLLAQYVWDRPNASAVFQQATEPWIFSPHLVVLTDRTMQESGHPEVPPTAVRWIFSVQKDCGGFLSAYLRPASPLPRTINVSCRVRLLKRPVDIAAILANPHSVPSAGEMPWEQRTIIADGSESWAAKFGTLRTAPQMVTLKADGLADATTGAMAFLLEVIVPKDIAAMRNLRSTPFADNFVTLLRSGLHTDISIVAHDGTIAAHRAVLCARCPMLRRQFSSAMADAKENTVHFDGSKLVAAAFLEFIYSGHYYHNALKLNHMQHLELFQAASFYQGAELMEALLETFRTSLDLSNAISTFQTAEMLAGFGQSKAASASGGSGGAGGGTTTASADRGGGGGGGGGGGIDIDGDAEMKDQTPASASASAAQAAGAVSRRRKKRKTTSTTDTGKATPAVEDIGAVYYSQMKMVAAASDDSKDPVVRCQVAANELMCIASNFIADNARLNFGKMLRAMIDSQQKLAIEPIASASASTSKPAAPPAALK